MEVMKEYPDNYFDLAIVDPPYGGGQHFNFRYGTGDQVYDSHKPDVKYWEELFRVSKHQIVWGGNYFTDNLYVNRCWICWQKGQPLDSFSDFELAWTSFDKVSSTAKLDSYGFNHADKRNGESTIHPTQKPVQLYAWIYHKYADKGFRIIDTHLGSGSNAIAAHYAKMGEFVACEIDEYYFKASMKRFKEQTAQLKAL